VKLNERSFSVYLSQSHPVAQAGAAAGNSATESRVRTDKSMEILENKGKILRDWEVRAIFRAVVSAPPQLDVVGV
jgi:hypothetical protein